MKTLFIEKEIKYIGSQLAPHWIYKNFHIQGDAIVAFVGEVDVDLSEMVDIEDVISDDGEAEGVKMRVSYKQRIIDFLAANRNLPVLKKIKNIEQLSVDDVNELERILWEELGSREEYDNHTNGMLCGANVAIFIRSVIGVDRKEAIERFGRFISGSALNAEQEEFLMTIISYVCENGDITKEIVVNESPFDERLFVLENYMKPFAEYIDNIHGVVIARA
jgi:type I restriction enzyme R subunit